MAEVERRVIRRAVSLDEHDGIRTIRGSAVVYDSPSYEISERGKKFTEYVRPGAFRDLQSLDVMAFLNHNIDKYLGRISNGTLRLNDTSVSLDFECDLPDTSAGDETYLHVKRGDLVGASFTADVIEEQWNQDNTECVLVALKLTEISPVFDPAYGDTSVLLRSLKRMKEQKEKQPPRYRSLEYAKLIIAMDEKD